MSKRKVLRSRLRIITTRRKQSLEQLSKRRQGSIFRFHLPWTSQSGSCDSPTDCKIPMQSGCEPLPTVCRRGTTANICADRELLLRHVVLDMFGELPTAEELKEFVTDNSSTSLSKLTSRLQSRPSAASFAGELPADEVNHSSSGRSSNPKTK